MFPYLFATWRLLAVEVVLGTCPLMVASFSPLFTTFSTISHSLCCLLTLIFFRPARHLTQGTSGSQFEFVLSNVPELADPNLVAELPPSFASDVVRFQ